MKKVTSLALATAMISLPAFAEPTVYGKVNLFLQQADDGNESVTELVSEASRIGVKGSEALSDSGLEAFYTFEYETSVDDGDKSGQTFTQRNIYVGVKGNFGAVQAGKFDTPVKTMQNKVDLFNDLSGDIKNTITNSENRTSNSIAYTTPSTMGGFVANVALILSEDEDVSDATSFALGYEANGFYAAVGMDSGVNDEDTDVVRGVFHYNTGNIQIGFLAEQEDNSIDDSTTGWVGSFQYKMDKVALKAQFGQSDIKAEGGETISIGADYKMSKNFTTHAFFTTADADNDAVDDQFIGVGAVLKF